MSDVESGKIPVCIYVRQAVARQRADLARQGSPGFPYRFDTHAAGRVLLFFSALRFTKGKWSQHKEYFKVEGWQAFILAVVFGWVCADGTRRFNRAYVEVPRKNGKTELGAGVMNYAFFEKGGADAPEVYSAATSKDQARIAFKQARSMAIGLKAEGFGWSAGARALQHVVMLGDGTMKALSSDDNVLDGLMPSMALVDEYHAHKDSAVLDVIESGMGSRENPMLFIITTAGSNITGPCYTQTRQGTVNILGKATTDERSFGIIYTIDKEDKWDDETAWIKANPNLGVSFELEFLRSKCTVAKNEGGTKRTEFMTKYVNIWSKQIEAWITPEIWALGNDPIDMEALKGRTCYAGIDLSSTMDITALCLFFPPEDDEQAVAIFRLWLPEDQADIRAKNGIPYDTWITNGYITATSGNVIDYSEIVKDVSNAAQDYNIRRLEIDPWNSINVELHLQNEGVPVSRLPQTIGALSSPTKELETMAMSGRIRHGGNPVMAWMMSNVMVFRDTNDNIRVHKGKSKEKVDGVAALVNAIAGWMTDRTAPDTGGSYMFEDDAELIML